MLPKFLLIAWFVLPVLFCGVMLCVRRRIHPVLVCVLCLASMIAGIFIIANCVWALDAHLLAEVDKYDPGTPEAERASEDWASDTGRSFALAFSAPLTAIWYLALFLLLFGSRWIRGQMFPTRSTSVHAQTDGETAEQQADNGNPYRSPIVG